MILYLVYLAMPFNILGKKDLCTVRKTDFNKSVFLKFSIYSFYEKNENEYIFIKNQNNVNVYLEFAFGEWLIKHFFPVIWSLSAEL